MVTAPARRVRSPGTGEHYNPALALRGKSWPRPQHPSQLPASGHEARGRQGRRGQEGRSGQEGPREEGRRRPRRPPRRRLRRRRPSPRRRPRRRRRPRPRRPRPPRRLRRSRRRPRRRRRRPAKKAAAPKPEPVKKAPRKPTTVICPLSGFEVKPEKPGLSPKALERLQASLLEERARHVQSGRRAPGRGRPARGRARGRRHPVRRGVGRGRHHQHRARARPPPLGLGAADRRRDRPRARAHGRRHLRPVRPRRSAHQPRAPRGAALRRDLRRLQGSCRATPLATISATGSSAGAPAAAPRDHDRPRRGRARPAHRSGGPSASCRDAPDRRARRRHRVRARAQHRECVQPLPGVHAAARDRGHRRRRRAGAHGAPHARHPDGGGAVAGARRRARQPDRPPVPHARVPQGRGGRLRPRRRLPDLQRRRLRHHHRRDPHRGVGGPRRRARAARRTGREPPVAEQFEVPEALAGERLDRAVALLTGWTRTRGAGPGRGGRRARRRRPRAQEPQARGRQRHRGARRAGGAPGCPRPIRRSRSWCVTRTTTSSWWPSPPGWWCIPGAGHPDGTLVNGLLARYPEIAGVGDPARPGIVHRLDRDTSGLLVVARSQAAYDGLVEMLVGARRRASLRRAGVGRARVAPRA